MDLEVITIGTELLLGLTIDTNVADISRAVAPIGGRVVRRSTVGDERADIKSAVSEALARTGFVIVTGGLGPTRDDVTKKAVAELFDAPLELDTDYLEQLRQRFEQIARGPMPESNRSQAEVPRGATVLTNQYGTAPGIWLEHANGVVVMLPGIPREVRGLLEDQVVPRLRTRIGGAAGNRPGTHFRVLRTTGVSESRLADIIGPLEDRLAPASLAYLPTLDGTDLRLTVWNTPYREAEPILEEAGQILRGAAGSYIYGEGDHDLADSVLKGLATAGHRLAVAESCTGGMIGSRLTAISGSSNVFLGGVICYSNESKLRDLGVPEAMLAQHGAVSEEVANAMVQGVCERFGATAGVAVTGIAGPTGGSSDKPVGTVWLAVVVGDERRAKRMWLPGGRHQVRYRSAQAALNLLRRMTNLGA